jgi:four helix bundle protein
MNYVRSFTELEVYKISRKLPKAIFETSKKFPAEEKFSLTDQVRRSSRSIGAQIAEAWGKRKYERHFISLLTDADSEQYETQHWIEIASECNYLSDTDRNQMLDTCQSLGRMLNSMIAKAHLFCRL